MNDRTHENEIDIVAIFEFCKRNIRIFIALPIIALLIGAIVAAVLPKLWEASALVQLGRVAKVCHVGQPCQASQIGDPEELVESISQAIARINTNSFQNDAAAKAKDEFQTIYRQSLSVSKVKGTDFIEIKLQAEKPELALAAMTSLTSHLEVTHEKLWKPRFERLNKQLEDVKESLQSSQMPMETLQKKLSQTPNLTSNEILLYSVYLQNKNIDLREREQRKIFLEEQLSADRSYPTKTVGSVQVSSKPVAPKTGIILLTSLLLGVLLAIVVGKVQAALLKKEVRILPAEESRSKYVSQ